MRPNYFEHIEKCPLNGQSAYREIIEKNSNEIKLVFFLFKNNDNQEVEKFTKSPIYLAISTNLHLCRLITFNL